MGRHSARLSIDVRTANRRVLFAFIEKPVHRPLFASRLALEPVCRVEVIDRAPHCCSCSSCHPLELPEQTPRAPELAPLPTDYDLHRMDWNQAGAG